MKTATRLVALAGILFLAAGAPTGAWADDQEEEATLFGGTLSGNAAVATDYMFRGYTQTSGAAVQGGIDWSHPSGFYVGTWGSNLDWAGNSEIDIYGGYAGEIGGLSYDLGIVYFMYPNEDDCEKPSGSSCEWDYVEFVLNTGFDAGPLGLSLGVLFSPEYWGEDPVGGGDTWYVSGGVAFPSFQLGELELAFDVNIGFTSADEELFAEGEDSYMDWNAGLGVGLPGGLSVDLRYFGSDLDEDDVLAGGWTDDQADALEGHFVVAVGYEF